MGWLNLLRENGDLWRLVITGATVFLCGPLAWVMSRGGFKPCRKFLAEVDKPQRNEARAKVRKGLELSRDKESKDDEDINALLNGLDDWRSLTNKTRSRIKSLNWSPWVFGGLVFLMLLAWACRLFSKEDNYFGASVLLLWFLSFCYLLILVAPLVPVFLEHGGPKSTKEEG